MARGHWKENKARQVTSPVLARTLQSYRGHLSRVFGFVMTRRAGGLWEEGRKPHHIPNSGNTALPSPRILFSYGGPYTTDVVLIIALQLSTCALHQTPGCCEHTRRCR